jgi:purine-binding chemotaxis protein CheW
MTKTEQLVNTCIIVLEIGLDDETTVLGALADSVQEVIELEPAQIEPPPKIGTRLRTEFIRGIGKGDSEFIMILDIDKVFSSDELSAIEGAAEEEQVSESSLKDAV